MKGGKSFFLEKKGANTFLLGQKIHNPAWVLYRFCMVPNNEKLYIAPYAALKSDDLCQFLSKSCQLVSPRFCSFRKSRISFFVFISEKNTKARVVGQGTLVSFQCQYIRRSNATPDAVSKPVETRGACVKKYPEF